MDNQEEFSGKITRRDLLKAVIIGTGAMGIEGLTGCSPKIEDYSLHLQDKTRKGWYEPRRSEWFTQLGQNNIRCDLCPKECVLAPGDRSPCNVRENRDGNGYTLAYGNPALVQEDPIERKPFYHVMPSSRVLSICTAGCNLSCKFCELWDIALVRPEEVHAYQMTPEDVIDHAQSCGVSAISFAFGEPVAFYEYMSDIAELAKNAALKRLIHTAGFIKPEPLNAICGKLDAAIVDLKSFDPNFYRDVVGGELEPVLRTLKTMRESGLHIEITHLVIPTLNDDFELIGRMCDWIVSELGADTPIHFSRFYPLYKLSALPRTPVATLDRAREVARKAGLNYVYIAKVIGHEGENTFCANCGEMIIHRVGFMVEEKALKSGKCGFCGYTIPGLWA